MKYSLPEGLLPETETLMKAVVKKLRQSSALEDTDHGSLNMLAYSYDMYVRAAHLLMDEGLFPEDERGRRKINPAVKLHQQYYAQVLAWMRELGMTVRSRERIKAMTPEVDAKNPLLQFLSNG